MTTTIETKIARKRTGAWLLQGETVISEVLRRPGPTNGFFDVLAAAVSAFSPGSRFAMLGFAAGGLVAPLRALGFDAHVSAVDLDLSGVELFRELCDSWAGSVHVDCEEASRWLRRRRGRYDCILEDLSMPHPTLEVVKPEVTWTTLPELVRSRLDRDGVAVWNLLPSPGMSGAALVRRVAAVSNCAFELRFEEYDNVVVLAFPESRSARGIGSLLRKELRRLGSDQVGSFRLRSVARPR